ncbi:MAG: hypothetical protein ACI4J1_12575 [Ruminiclostridium sp.]
MKYRNYNTQDDDMLIKLSDILISYCPESVKKDKYFKTISNKKIIEICFGYKKVINDINSKHILDLEEYTELLHAIGFMIADFYKNRFTKILNRIVDEYCSYSFSVDTGALIDIALGKNSSEIKWCSKRKNNEVWILRFKYNSSGELIYCRNNKADEKPLNVSGNHVVQIGMLKMYISDAEKKIYCFSTADEYLYVRKSADNKYFACPSAA